ncbi:helix-turn-helix domain-containing protein [Paenibacillus macerans]|nr:helix-turn-helix domain-containing protein [Paenibacillus macerans]
MNTAYNLVNSGEIESFRVGNSHRIRRSAVTDYIIRKSTGSYRNERSFTINVICKFKYRKSIGNTSRKLPFTSSWCPEN